MSSSSSSHLAYDAARIVGLIPGQRTIKTECGKRVAVERIDNTPRVECAECRASLLEDARRNLEAIRSMPAESLGLGNMRAEAIRALEWRIARYSLEELEP